MEELNRDIYITFQKLMRNLGWDYEIDDPSYLTSEELYVEIYRTMFPMLEPMILQIAALEESYPGERIQNLIEILSLDILKLDLSHIRGRNQSLHLLIAFRGHGCTG